MRLKKTCAVLIVFALLCGGALKNTAHAQAPNFVQEIRDNYIKALMLMTEQLSAVTMHSTMAIGTFFDAKMQLEAQRKHQELKARAVKDYHPNEEMCRVGSYVRSVATSEQKAESDARMISERLVNLYMAEKFGAASRNSETYIKSRLDQFRKIYCDPDDNNEGLAVLCDHDQQSGGQSGVKATDPLRVNKDIDFARTIDLPKTLDIDFQDGSLAKDEADILALAANLYWPTPLEWTPDNSDLPKRSRAMQKARRVLALNSVAHNSFATYAGLKAQAPDNNAEAGWAHMKTFMKEFGLTEPEIEKWIGQRPSYWAQMDVLTKKMLQHPNFYTNLYDKPANVDRMGVVLEALALMQLRDHYDSSLRSELIKAAMVESELGTEIDKANINLMLGR